MKTNIALVVMVLLCLFSVRMVLQINECKSELIEVKQTAEIISIQQNAINEQIKAIEISKGNYTTIPDKAPYSRDIPLSDELQRFTYETATKYGVNYDLMLAIMQTESQFQNVVSDNGEDIGLCQINACNAEWLYSEYGIYNLMDERQNIEACAIILNKLQGQFESESHVVMAYNLGAGKAEKYIKSGKITEYTEKVYENLKEITGIKA